MSRGYDKIAFVASQSPEATERTARLVDRYGNCDPAAADVVVALGGDGLMLQTLRALMRTGKPVYGMHRGTVGFLMNEFNDVGLKERLAAAQTDRDPSAGDAARDRGRNNRTSITPSTRSRCSARPIRRRGCASWSTARNGCRN